ncbi:MAG TPA: hypothetical protein VFR95_05445 [Gemmatimonadaceae bacterium]|nr:hypothetical protein [Gemmatimonadaceae bacterium]
MSTEAIPTKQPSTVLPRDLSDFVIELSIALHKHAMYPEGHPSLNVARAGVARRLDALLRERGSLALGVARNQLIIEGLATDARNPLLLALAQHLHRHGVGAVKFEDGVRVEEIDAMLGALAADPDRDGSAFEPGSRSAHFQSEHISLLPLTYDQLELVDDTADSAATSTTQHRTSQLWLDLARAALQYDEKAERPPDDPTVVADAINAHAREQAYDQVIIGYLLQISSELSSGDKADSALLRKRVSELINALEPKQLRRILEQGGDFAQRQRFLLDASKGLTVDAALALVEAGAEGSQQVISEALMRLFSKLALHAESGAPEVKPEAELALRSQIQRLVSGWVLPDPSSARYGAILEHISVDRPTFAVADGSVHGCESARLVQMSLEVGAAGPMLREAVLAMLGRGELPQLLDMLEAAPERNGAATAIVECLATADHLRALLDERPADSREVSWVAMHLGAIAAEPLLDALAVAETRAARRALLDHLAALGSAIGPAVAARIPGAPWYVQRNMLSLLEAMHELPAGFSAVPYASHQDPRVRRQAIRVLLEQESERDAAVLIALRDRDEQTVRLGLGRALESCPEGALEVIRERLAGHTLDSELELLAIRVVASVEDPAAVDCLLEYVVKSRGWFRGTRLAKGSPRTLVALAGLATHWRSDPRVATVLQRALRHPDPAVRAAAMTEERTT